MPAKKRDPDRKRKTALEMLTRSHRRLDETMGLLCDALATIAKGETTASTDETVSECLAFLRGPAARHVRDEEDSIFPRLGPSHSGLATSLIEEHRTHARLIQELFALCKAPMTAAKAAHARDRADTLRAAYKSHSEREEDELWPAIEALPDMARLIARREMRHRRGK